MWKAKEGEKHGEESKSRSFSISSISFAFPRDDPEFFILFFIYMGSECFTFTQRNTYTISPVDKGRSSD